MRKLISFAAVAALLCACSKEMEAPVESSEQTDFRLSAFVQNADDELKSYIDDNNTILWGKGEYMTLWFNDGSDKFVKSESSSADAYNGKAKAVFNFKLSPASASAYKFGGLYPSSAVSHINGISNDTPSSLIVNISSSQNAVSGSYDPKSFILMAKPQSQSTIPSEMTAYFRPAVALNKLTLKGVKEKVSSVIITAPGKALAGGREFDLTTGKVGAASQPEESIRVSFASALPAGDVDIFFSSWDVALAAGEKLTIQVVGQTQTYTKTITAGSNGISFKEEYLNKLAINFASVAGAAFSIKDFAAGFVGVLEAWKSNVGTITVDSGDSFTDVNYVPANYSFTLGNVTYNKSKAFDVAIKAFNALLAGGSITDAVPAAGSYSWSGNPYNEGKGNGGPFQNSFVYLNFIQNSASRQTGYAAEHGVWANFCRYTDENGNVVDSGTPSVKGEYAGLCCLERHLLIMARLYKYILDNSISSDFATALSGVSLSSDLYGSKFASRVSYSQIHSETADEIAGSCNVGILNVKLTGSVTVTSVNAKSSGAAPADGDVKFVNLNCTKKAATLSSTPTCFRLVMRPGTYTFTVTICDSNHKMMTFTLKNCKINAGTETVVSKAYKTASNVLFYEGFDNFVWGGDYVGGSSAPAWAPDATTMGTTGRTDATGYEDPAVKTTYGNAGAGFIQSNTWADVSGKTVPTSHIMSDSYVKSRNISDYVYLFRCRERPGYIEVGCANNGRGSVRTGNLTQLTTLTHTILSFDVCLKYGFNDSLSFAAYNGAHVRALKVNGSNIELSQKNSYFRMTDATLLIYPEDLKKPASAAAAKEWNHVEIELDNVNNATQLSWSTKSASAGNHGFYLDNIKLVKNTSKPTTTFRLLYWNIQNGMWADQPAKYANFVKWVKKYNPDVCVWCEAKTNYKDNSEASATSIYFPNNWLTEAKKYGHNYYALGGYRDNFPQAVTSKYPITTKLKITTTNNSSKPIAHGAGLHSITIGGREIYFLTMHTWPQKYGFGVTGDAAREASAAKFEGDYYREYEMNYVMSKTVNNSTYSSHPYWLFMGDLNSRSRCDNWYYNYAEDSTLLICQDVVRKKTKLVDVIEKWYPGDFVSSTGGKSRIDYVYASPSMYSSVSNATIVIDDWTIIQKTNLSNFYLPSDHRPIIVDFAY